MLNAMNSKILFCGGGTLGPVTPLLAVLRRMREMRPTLKFSWIGTPQGPEAPLVQAEGAAFHALPVAKLARYPSVNWLAFPFAYLTALREARKILEHEHPSAIFSAGGYTQVPVMRVAAKNKIPCAVHQLDYTPLLSNKAVAKQCRLVTVSFGYPVSPFGAHVKTVRVATPCRFAGIPTPERAAAATILGFNPDKPVVFITGGGTGAVALNQAVWEILDELLGQTQVLHLTGQGKMSGAPRREGYKAFEFFNETQMLNAYSAAVLVVSRGGFGSLSELAALSKPSIIVPLPDSPQNQNVRILGKGIVTVEQSGHFATKLKNSILELLRDRQKRENLGHALHELLPTDNGSELAGRWLELLD